MTFRLPIDVPWFRWGLVAGLGVFLVACAPPGPRALLQGERLLAQGKPAEAIPKIETAVQLLPGEARALNYLGLAYHRAGRAEEAGQAYRQALTIDRNLANARFNLGCLLLELNQPGPAIAELTTFTGLRVNSGVGWLKLGHAQLRAGQSEPAERSFRRALELGMPAGPVLNGIGLTMVQRRLYPVAWQQFQSAERQQPTYAPAILNAAIVADQYLRKRDLAIEGYRKYLALSNPSSAEAVRRALAVCEAAEAARRTPTNLASAGQSTESASARKAGTVATPTPAPSRKPEPATPSRATETAAGSGAPPSDSRTTNQAPSTILARTDVPTSKPAISVTNPAAGAASDPRKQPAVSAADQSGSRLTSNAVPEVVRTPLPSPKPDPVTTAPADAPAPTVSVRGATTPAAQVDATGYPYATFDDPQPGNRSEAVRLLNEGLNEQRALRGRDALEKYRLAAQADPTLFEAHYNRGVAAFEVGELAESLRAYERALFLNETSVPARFNFSTALDKAGYPDAAARELELLLEANPNEARAHLALGNLYAGRPGKRALARPHYRKVLELEPQHPQAGALRFWLEANP